MKLPRPVESVQQAIALIDAHEGKPEDFALAVADELQDPIGMNMAVITDRILQRGWHPDGFVSHPGFKLYRYKPLD